MQEQFIQGRTCFSARTTAAGAGAPSVRDLTANIDREKLQMMGKAVPPHALSRHDGQANFSALTAIAESPLDGNVLYTGADDGTVQVTRDGGKKWSNLSANLRGVAPG